MCDTYDALRCRREYKKPYPPNVIYNIMNQQKGKRFDPELLDRFFQEVGIYPLGTLVKLNNDMVAIVKEQNKEAVLKPKIEVLKPFESAGKLIDLTQEEQLNIVEIVEEE
jgi:HD-GYP domain-containing protein (c-di-GMP phosphodiesterase class II)